MQKILPNIRVLMDEHANILRMLNLLEIHSIKFMNDKNTDTRFYDDFIDFTRNYADDHHHGKEELILFQYMVDKLGPTAIKLVTNGMLVEHDLGRFYIKTLETSLLEYRENPTDELRLNILMAAMAYANLLKRHVDKENDLVYPFAARMLAESDMAEVELQSIEYENTHSARREHYIGMLNRLESEIMT